MKYDVKTGGTLALHEHLLSVLLTAYLLRHKEEGDEPFRQWIEGNLKAMNVSESVPSDAPVLEIQGEAIRQFRVFWGQMLPSLAAQRAAKRDAGR